MNELQGGSQHSGLYKVRIDEQVREFLNPEPTGRELLATVGLDPTKFFLIQSLEGQPDQILELDEPFDLRAPGTEVLIVVSRERHFPIQIDEQEFTVKGPFVTGAKVLELADKNPNNHFVTQVLVGVDDIVVGLEDKVDLTVPGRERFTIVAKPCEITVNTRPRNVTGPELTFEQVIRLAFDTSNDNANTAYTVAYSHGDPTKPEGSMVKGGSVKVRCGMIFDVDRTDRS